MSLGSRDGRICPACFVSSIIMRGSRDWRNGMVILVTEKRMFGWRGERKVKSDSGTHKIKKECFSTRVVLHQVWWMQPFGCRLRHLREQPWGSCKTHLQNLLEELGVFERIQVIHNILVQSGDLSSGCPVRRVANTSKMASQGSK